jgi:hypothetical protein
VVDGKLFAIGRCGRGDGGMIFNTDVLDVAPPHTLMREFSQCSLP